MWLLKTIQTSLPPGSTTYNIFYSFCHYGNIQVRFPYLPYLLPFSECLSKSFLRMNGTKTTKKLKKFGYKDTICC